MKHLTIPKNSILLIGVLGYIVLFALTFKHKQPPLFDEPLFIPNVALFEKHGLSKEFLLEMDNQAPGPLYQLVHTPLKPITHMETPGIRLVNTTMLGLIILILAAIILQLQRTGFKDALIWAFGIMAVPMVWQVSGLALTEIPAMFFASLSILCIITGLNRLEKVSWQGYLLSLIGGVCLGLAIIGRSPFLLVILAVPVLLLQHFRSGKRWVYLILYGAVALAICIPVFWIWKGLVPPKQAIVSAGGIKPWHGLLAFAYAALFTFILAPRWFHFEKRTAWALVIAYVVLLVLNVAVLHYEYAPLSEALGKLLPAAVMNLYPYLISPALATLALYFIYCCGLQALAHRQDPVFLFLLVCGIFILATSFKVTHLFSSRYVAQAAPLFVVLFAGYDKMSAGRGARLIIGMVIGFLSLETYFLFN